jgi:hypothetical protein
VLHFASLSRILHVAPEKARQPNVTRRALGTITANGGG